jgi:hypothetical protein
MMAISRRAHCNVKISTVAAPSAECEDKPRHHRPDIGILRPSRRSVHRTKRRGDNPAAPILRHLGAPVGQPRRRLIPSLKHITSDGNLSPNEDLRATCGRLSVHMRKQGISFLATSLEGLGVLLSQTINSLTHQQRSLGGFLL